MFHDGRRGWQKARRRMAHKFGVNILAKLWVRSKRLRELRTSYLRRTLPSTSRKCRPLREGEIRLLQIKPGYTLSTIECDFVYVDLQSAGDYAALSYTWGICDPSIPILVNKRVSLITENLYLALIHLRQREVTMLWVDALCINQDDLAERARQVAQMKEVYCRAAIVHIWLGESNELSERAFDELHGLSEHLDYDAAVPSRFFDEVAMNGHHQRWRAISEILYRPWFRRVWVIQEALSARRAMMVCGKDIIDLDLFLRLINSMIKAGVLDMVMSYHPQRHELPGGPIRTAIKQLEFLVKAKFEVTNFLTAHKFKPTLLNYLAGTRWAEATNPLDKVYGILSLADDARTLGSWDVGLGKNRRWLPFKVDYNLSKEEVFINATKAILCTTRSLDVLRFARYDPDSANGLPSWVADWANKTPHRVFGHMSVCPTYEDKKPSWRSYLATSDQSYIRDPIYHDITLHCSPEFYLGKANTLNVKGIHFDTITALSTNVYPREHAHGIDPQSKDPTELFEPMQQHLRIITQWIDDCVQLARRCSPYPTRQSPLSSLWRTLSGGVTPENSLMPQGFEALLSNLSKAESALGALKTQLSSVQSKWPDALSEIAASAALSHFESLVSWLSECNSRCHSRKFAITRKKYMGLVPDGAIVGDFICIMYGCEMPLILRKCGRNSFRLIGYGEFEGLVFDDAVVEEKVVLKRRENPPEERFDFVTWDKFGGNVGVRLKKLRS
ncbi:HET-domain-containing protein [Lindgomyces ingoldianus]|uniref:HET-domain-containing protein n=1 Tax=Lindgomyces ingoldianus TaxID=673940 RepID=A0ACB6R9I1_9PLEO|nr:HET-domain-containing protein [Lindgomyces ingoldianus]KAF2475914.1 HET-domain-containing protein [Lindgomyces ingoldianus]